MILNFKLKSGTLHKQQNYGCFSNTYFRLGNFVVKLSENRWYIVVLRYYWIAAEEKTFDGYETVLEHLHSETILFDAAKYETEEVAREYIHFVAENTDKMIIDLMQAINAARKQ